MFSGIGWLAYIKTIVLVVVGYYLVIGWIYRKELQQWLKDRNK